MTPSIEQAVSLDLPNYIVLRSDLATSGQPSPDQIRALPGFGFRAMVNLLPIDSSRALLEEGEIAREAGLEYHPFPVLFDWPTMEDVDELNGILDSLEGKQTLVHCGVNCRGAFLISAYLMKRGDLSRREAEAVIHRVWCPLGLWKELWEELASARTHPGGSEPQ